MRRSDLMAVSPMWLVPGYPSAAVPVSYTHLDVYKRQVLNALYQPDYCYRLSADARLRLSDRCLHERWR